jgi:hypothetical protein
MYEVGRYLHHICTLLLEVKKVEVWVDNIEGRWFGTSSWRG